MYMTLADEVPDTKLRAGFDKNLSKNVLPNFELHIANFRKQYASVTASHKEMIDKLLSFYKAWNVDFYNDFRVYYRAALGLKPKFEQVVTKLRERLLTWQRILSYNLDTSRPQRDKKKQKAARNNGSKRRNGKLDKKRKPKANHDSNP
jgi:hypothetical protein